MKQNAKICAIGETEYIMKLEVFILGGQKFYQKRKKRWWREREERGLRKGAEGYIEINELTI